MKTIKNLTVTVTYTVGLEDIEVPEEVYAVSYTHLTLPTILLV